MTHAEAADLIDGIARSLEADPGQFHLEVNVIGQMVQSRGGIGLHVSDTGGGPGSTTIGQVVSAGGNQVEIAHEAATDAMKQQYATLLGALKEIAVQLRTGAPNAGKVRTIVDSLKNTWVPGVITSMLGTILDKALGL